MFDFTPVYLLFSFIISSLQIIPVEEQCSKTCITLSLGTCKQQKKKKNLYSDLACRKNVDIFIIYVSFEKKKEIFLEFFHHVLQEEHDEYSAFKEAYEEEESREYVIENGVKRLVNQHYDSRGYSSAGRGELLLSERSTRIYFLWKFLRFILA